MSALDELKALESEASSLAYKAGHAQQAAELANMIRSCIEGAGDGLFDMIRSKESKLNHGGYSLNDHHKLLHAELKAILDELGVDIIATAKQRLLAKHRELTMQAAQKRALITASILPVGVK